MRPSRRGLTRRRLRSSAQLVRDGGFGHPHERGEVADAQLAVRQRVENAHARRIAQRAERLGQIGDVVFADEGRAQLSHPRGVEVDDVAEVWEHMSDCSYVHAILSTSQSQLRPGVANYLGTVTVGRFDHWADAGAAWGSEAPWLLRPHDANWTPARDQRAASAALTVS